MPDNNPPDKCDWNGGHITLQVKHNGHFGHLGWWPSYWDLYRSETGVIRRLVRPLEKWVWEWGFPHSGKRTLHATKEEEGASLDPADFDSIMATSVKLDPKKPTVAASLKEAQPSYIAYLCVPDLEAVLRHIHNFNSRKSRYHVVFNNCATVVMNALAAGSAKRPKSLIVYPFKLLKHCEANLICKDTNGRPPVKVHSARTANLDESVTLIRASKETARGHVGS